MKTITAYLKGPDTISVPDLGIEVSNRVPVCFLARKLEQLGHGDAILDVFRGTMRVFERYPVSKWALLTVAETSRPTFTKYVPFKGSEASE